LRCLIGAFKKRAAASNYACRDADRAELICTPAGAMNSSSFEQEMPEWRDHLAREMPADQSFAAAAAASTKNIKTVDMNRLL